MKKLWVQLTLAFALVVIIAVLVASVATNRQMDGLFRRFVARYPHAHVMERLAQYYEHNGSWDGIDDVIPEQPEVGGVSTPVSSNNPMARRGMGMGQRRPDEAFEHHDDEEERRGGPPIPLEGLNPDEVAVDFLLFDTKGYIVYDSTGKPAGRLVKGRAKKEAVPIFLHDKIVGYLFIQPSQEAELPLIAKTFLQNINRTLLQAGFIAGIIGVILGIAIARGLSAPLGRLEAAARQFSSGHLEQRVPVEGTEEIASVARAFNDMAASIQQAQQLQQNMVADVAHELRTPLSVLQGNLQAILEDVYPMEKAEIATLYDETLILGRLVNDLHELAKAEAGQLHLNMQETDIAAIVERHAALFSDFAAEKDITLNVVMPDIVPLVMADPGRVQQVLHNLLSNALRYTPAGGTIHVQIEHIAQHRDSDAQHTVRVAVVDTGPGIAADSLSFVFDRFWRTDSSRSRDQGGSGLGLAIAKQLIEAQDGHVGVESVVGQGSRFWFTLNTVPHNVRL